MIISRTPFRVSLAGGGSDLRDYYRLRPGYVVSMAISQFMYVTVNKRFDDSIRVSYTRTEIVDHVDDLRHDLIREAMKLTGLTRGLEITTIADLPAGIGLGSSSSLTVGVLNALYAMKGEWRSPEDLAREACEIEVDILKRPIGKQDQYIAAYGGFQEVTFLPDESVRVHPVICPPSTRDRLTRHLMLFFTGITRDAGAILSKAKDRLANHSGATDTIDGLVAIAHRLRRVVVGGKVRQVGGLLDESWQLKKRMAVAVSSSDLDTLYAAARRAGADGGKVAGAGGGGCLLLFARPSRQPGVRAVASKAGLREVPVVHEPEGSRIVHYSR